MKYLRNNMGAIGIGTVLTIVGLFLTVFGGVMALESWNISYTNAAVNPLQDELHLHETQNATDIASVKSDLRWIKSALAANGFAPKTVDIASTTPQAINTL